MSLHTHTAILYHVTCYMSMPCGPLSFERTKLVTETVLYEA